MTWRVVYTKGHLILSLCNIFAFVIQLLHVKYEPVIIYWTVRRYVLNIGVVFSICQCEYSSVVRMTQPTDETPYVIRASYHSVARVAAVKYCFSRHL